uniref:TPPII domain-containing protein n=1 Tax=Angiostrongylus cantonensis TaxID=6313 RepID=A0A0K0D510_ANGCA
MGPLFRVPITIIRPEVVARQDDFSYTRSLVAESGIPIRHFLVVPHSANICEIRIENLQRQSADRFTLHCVQLVNQKCFRNTETLKNLSSNCFEWTAVVPVIPNRTLEVCIARSWTRGQQGTPISLKCRFHGIDRPSVINLIHGAPYVPFRVEAAAIRPIEIKPVISLNTLHVPFKPVSAKIGPLGPRDLLADGKQYTYKVEKGEYTAQVQVRHPNTDQLELLADTPLHVRLHVTPALTLDITSFPNAGEDAFKWANKILNAGQQVTLYASGLPDDKVPKTISVTGGSFLTGNLVMVADNDLRMADKTAVTYLFTEYSTRPSKALSMVTFKEKKADFSCQEQEMEESIRDAQISWLTKLKDPLAVDRLYTELISKYPTHLPLLLTKLRLLTDKKRSRQETETLNLIVTQIIEQCQPDEVLKYNGSRNDCSVEQLALRKSMDERKAAIIDSILACCHSAVDEYLALSKKVIPPIFRNSLRPVFDANTTKDEVTSEQVDKADESKSKVQTEANGTTTTSEADGAEEHLLKDIDVLNDKLLHWIAADDAKALLFSAKYSVAHGYMGRACSYLQKLIENMRTNGKDASMLELALIEVCEHLGWFHVANRLRNDRLVRNRSSFRPF